MSIFLDVEGTRLVWRLREYPKGSENIVALRARCFLFFGRREYSTGSKNIVASLLIFWPP